MKYKLQRPAKRAGTGPLTVYRSTNRSDLSTIQTPQRWVMSQPAYAILSATPAASTAAQLQAAIHQHVPKIWTELAYEDVRRRLAPGAPSRLESLFAFADPVEAFSLEQVTNVDKAVWEAEVSIAAPWALVDMSHFEIGEYKSFDEAGFQDAWNNAADRASKYWMPGGTIATAEILVGGTIELKRQLNLVDLFRHIGLIE